MKINDTDKKFLDAFSQSNEWAILKARLIEPLLQDIESVNSEFKFEEGTTSGERFVGRQLGSKFSRGLIEMIEKFGKDVAKEKKPEDFFE